jgi:hypothetical protein
MGSIGQYYVDCHYSQQIPSDVLILAVKLNLGLLFPAFGFSP